MAIYTKSQRCICCWSYITKSYNTTKHICLSCYVKQYKQGSKRLHSGVTSQRAEQIGIDWKINARANEYWRNMRPCDIPNHPADILMMKTLNTQLYLFWRSGTHITDELRRFYK